MESTAWEHPVTNPQPSDPTDDELSRLRAKLDRIMEGFEGTCMTCEPVGSRNQQLEQMLKVMQEQVEHYVQERDEARREVCNLNAEEYGSTPEHHADGRGWNCFKETP
jgi:DNA repair ATPase RecN